MRAVGAERDESEARESLHISQLSCMCVCVLFAKKSHARVYLIFTLAQVGHGGPSLKFSAARCSEKPP